jgi:hypothetical protein
LLVLAAQPQVPRAFVVLKVMSHASSLLLAVSAGSGAPTAVALGAGVGASAFAKATGKAPAATT